MNTKLQDIKNDVIIWNRWGYDFFNRQIVCYTDNIIDFNEKKDRWEVTYKPKMWVNNVTWLEFLALFNDIELRKTFRVKACENDWFTEYEKAEHNEDGKTFISEDSSLNLFDDN